MKILKIINRIFVPSETFEKTIFFYEQLANQKCHLRSNMMKLAWS
ncbi:hypothetical protein [Paenibacillus apiarius]|nr:hypothetical protein [Paenibacillus apiarius]